VLSLSRPERQADHSPPFGAEVKYEWSYACPAPLRLRGAVRAVGLYVGRRPRHAEPKIYVDGFLFNLLFQFFVALNATTANRQTDRQTHLIACYLNSVSVSL
jgi:hypothetical protein